MKVEKNVENQGRFRQPEENRSDETGITATSTPLKMFKERLSKTRQDVQREGNSNPARPSVIKNVKIENSYNIPTYNRYSFLDQLSPLPQLDGNTSFLSSSSEN